jgi:hypothetical protein
MHVNHFMGMVAHQLAYRNLRRKKFVHNIQQKIHVNVPGITKHSVFLLIMIS